MAEKSQINCRFHEFQPYLLYCKDCKDCVCLECLSEKHQKHEFCQMKDAKKEIHDEVLTYINDDHEDQKTWDHIFELSEQRKCEIQKAESEITNQIEDATENQKSEIDFQKECLLTDLTKICYEKIQSVNSLQNRAEELKHTCAPLNATRVEENTLFEIVHLFSEMKACSDIKDKMSQSFIPPIFEQNQSKFKIGSLMERSVLYPSYKDSKMNILSEENQKGTQKAITIGTQTENESDTDSEADWFDAEDICDVENSSDEIREEYPVTINFDKESKIKNIHKIVPVSNQDAWILSNGTLRKVTNLVLEDEVYASSVSDFILMKDGNVLISDKNDAFIKKLLPNKRLVRFAEVNYGVIDCFCEGENDSINLLKREYSINRSDTHHLIKFNNLGMVLSHKRIDLPYLEIPLSMTNSICNTDLYVVYKITGNKRTISFIRKIGYTEEKKIEVFTGAIGLNPRQNFICYGITCDNEANVLVSDNIHHCVYALDENLKFSKFIAGAEQGLESPRAIALHDNLLWVADDHKIFIFDYRSLNVKTNEKNT